MQAVSYSVTREKAPIYTMGSADVRAFSRNKRGIAGSLVWVNFDRHALLDLVYKLGGQFVANVDDLRPQFMTDQNAFLSQNAIYQSSLQRADGVSSSATIDEFSGQPVSSVSGFKTEASPWYSDQILPFDITLAGTNERRVSLSPKLPLRGRFLGFYSVLRGEHKNLVSRGRSSRPPAPARAGRRSQPVPLIVHSAVMPSRQLLARWLRGEPKNLVSRGRSPSRRYRPEWADDRNRFRDCRPAEIVAEEIAAQLGASLLEAFCFGAGMSLELAGSGLEVPCG